MTDRRRCRWRELRRRVGDVSQVVSTREVRLGDGNEDGVRAIDVRVDRRPVGARARRPGPGHRPGLGGRPPRRLAEHDRHRGPGPVRRGQLAALVPRRPADHLRAPERGSGQRGRGRRATASTGASRTSRRATSPIACVRGRAADWSRRSPASCARPTSTAWTWCCGGRCASRWASRSWRSTTRWSTRGTRRPG